MIDTKQSTDIRTCVSLTELQDAGLISPDRGGFTSTPQPPRKKQKTSHKHTSPYPYSTHTPRHHPQAYQQNTHFSFKQNYGKGTPQSKFTPQQQNQKEAKKKKKEKSAVIVIDEDADFPRGGKKSPNKPFGTKKNNKKKYKKKQMLRKLKKREQKAAKDSSMYPSDENLFQIKQRNGKR